MTTAHHPPDVMPVVVHIDDDQELLELSQLALQSIPIRFVGIVRSQAGLETVRFLRPALVLLDLMMAEMDGWDLLDAIRSDPALARKSAVFCGCSEALLRQSPELSPVVARAPMRDASGFTDTEMKSCARRLPRDPVLRDSSGGRWKTGRSSFWPG